MGEKICKIKTITIEIIPPRPGSTSAGAAAAGFAIVPAPAGKAAAAPGAAPRDGRAKRDPGAAGALSPGNTIPRKRLTRVQVNDDAAC